MSIIGRDFYKVAKEAANLAKECRRDENSQNEFLDALIRLEGLPKDSTSSITLAKCSLAAERLLELAIKM